MSGHEVAALFGGGAIVFWIVITILLILFWWWLGSIAFRTKRVAEALEGAARSLAAAVEQSRFNAEGVLRPLEAMASDVATLRQIAEKDDGAAPGVPTATHRAAPAAATNIPADPPSVAGWVAHSAAQPVAPTITADPVKVRLWMMKNWAYLALSVGLLVSLAALWTVL